MTNFNGLPLYELRADKENEGVFCISLVEFPAIEQNFLVFADAHEYKFTQVYEDKHILYGPAMIPDLPIYRRDAQGKEYYVTFSKETIAQIAEKFHKDSCNFNISVDHETDVDGCFVFTSYIIDRANGIDPVQFKDLQDGTWIVGVKVENDAVWDAIKDRELFKGFSVEVIATPFRMSKEVDEKPKNWLEELLKGKLILK